MNLCGACDRLSKAISRNEPIRKQYHGQTINLLSSEWTCSLCSFLCSCSVHRNVEDKDYPILRNVLGCCGPFDEKHYITYSIFSEKCSFIIRTPSSAYNCIILISADLGSPATSAGWRLPPTLRPNSNRADHFAFVRSWLAGCLTHSRCKRKRMYYHSAGSSTPVVNEESGPELPSRIIEIRSSHSTPSVRLRETHGLCGQYVALSHCWGPPDKRPLCTTKSNLASLLEEIPFESLPSTFRDAVELTYEIGLQYLWIDSLCIIQDDEEDWRVQSATMGDVYENATLTIGAASAENATEGLFKPIRQRQTPVTIPYYEDHTGEASQGFLIAEEAFNCSPYRSPLRNRGWVVQERILSRRLVSFTRAGLSWKCQESCLDQFGDRFYDQDYWQWIPLMQDYSYCQFTYESDRLIALEGLVNAMKRCERVPYYFGVWYGESVAPTILWMRNIFSPSVNDLPHIPSWSWASKFGPKSFFDSFVHYENDDIFWHPTELIDIEETGLMTISEAPMMLCGMGGFPDFHPKDQNLETIADLLLRIRSEPLSGIQSFHGDMKRLVGVAALDNESIHPSCCVSLLRWKTEFEYFGYNGLPKSHDPDKTMRPDNTGYEPMEHYEFYGLYKSEEEYEFEKEYQNFERVWEPKETGDIFPGSEFLKFTSQYWHVVLMLQPADQGENYFHRVGIGIIPENLWKKEEIRYARIHLV